MDEKDRFLVFCLENFKSSKKMTGKEAFSIFSKYGVFTYLEEFYDVLHTTGHQYLENDIDIYLLARGYKANSY